MGGHFLIAAGNNDQGRIVSLGPYFSALSTNGPLKGWSNMRRLRVHKGSRTGAEMRALENYDLHMGKFDGKFRPLYFWRGSSVHIRKMRIIQDADDYEMKVRKWAKNFDLVSAIGEQLIFYRIESDQKELSYLALLFEADEGLKVSYYFKDPDEPIKVFGFYSKMEKGQFFDVIVQNLLSAAGISMGREKPLLDLKHARNARLRSYSEIEFTDDTFSKRKTEVSAAHEIRIQRSTEDKYGLWGNPVIDSFLLSFESGTKKIILDRKVLGLNKQLRQYLKMYLNSADLNLIRTPDDLLSGMKHDADVLASSEKYRLFNEDIERAVISGNYEDFSRAVDGFIDLIGGNVSWGLMPVDYNSKMKIKESLAEAVIAARVKGIHYSEVLGYLRDIIDVAQATSIFNMRGYESVKAPGKNILLKKRIGTKNNIIQFTVYRGWIDGKKVWWFSK